jgi:type II secretory pathway component PulK
MSKYLNNHDGTAIVAVVVTIVFVSGIALGLMYWLWSESKQLGQQKEQTRALYYAEMGTQKAMQRLQFETTGTAAYHMFIDSATAGNTTDFYINMGDNNKVHVNIQEIP